ncbi:MAG: hypothetical protein NTV05_05490 [Acidobacteria bacterium]|nr:hypothetical protein [Acidobacteriota bacterium]
MRNVFAMLVLTTAGVFTVMALTDVSQSNTGAQQLPVSESRALVRVVQKPGFSLSISDGWQEIPTRDLVAGFDCGFKLTRPQTWMEYPYVLR